MSDQHDLKQGGRLFLNNEIQSGHKGETIWLGKE
jgi:hypothetical protein